eukprot:176695-Lingulodinium_polyedra.AAC.1
MFTRNNNGHAIKIPKSRGGAGQTRTAARRKRRPCPETAWNNAHTARAINAGQRVETRVG